MVICQLTLKMAEEISHHLSRNWHHLTVKKTNKWFVVHCTASYKYINYTWCSCQIAQNLSPASFCKLFCVQITWQGIRQIYYIYVTAWNPIWQKSESIRILAAEYSNSVSDKKIYYLFILVVMNGKQISHNYVHSKLLHIQGGPIKTVPFVFRCSIRIG